MSGVFHRRGPNVSSQVNSRMILDDGPIGPSDYQIEEHVFREPAGMDGNFDGLRHGSVHSMCPVHGSTHSIWRPVRQDSRESRAIFESGYRTDCPVHRPPPSVCSVHSASVHTAILNEEDVVVVPAEPPPEPEAPHEPPHEAPPEAPQYEEPLRPPTPAPELVQRVIEPEPPEQSPLHGSRRSSFGRRSASRHSRSRSRSRSRSLSRRPSLRGSQYSVRTGSRRSSSSYSTGIWSRREGYSGKSLLATLKEFYEKYPRLATALAVITFLYFFIHQLDATIAHLFECIVRILYPVGHYIAVTNEQFFARLSRMATRSDEMMEAFYCDVAKTWCQRFELMCEVRCSFVEQTLQRIRKYPH